jgi:hypothetical protein
VTLFETVVREGPDPTAMIELASHETGLTDFGDARLGPPLEAALRAFRLEAWPKMPEPFRRLAVRYLADFLTSRLQVVADRKRHPEIARIEIRRPLIIIGPPRSGSTLLHTLLSLDPENIAPPHWVCLEPSPPPGLGEPAQGRIARAETRMKAFFDQIPDVYVTHPYMIEEGANALAECGTDIMSMALTCQAMWAYYPIPSYREYLLGGDHGGAVAFHHDFLQHVQWGGGASRWALKGSDHLTWLRELHAQYPDANLIWTHRDLAQLLGSQASIIGILRGLSGPVDADDRRRVAAEAIEHQQKLFEKGMRARDAIGEDRFYDVSYHDVMADPVRTVERIYERFGLSLSATAAENIRDWAARNPQAKHGVHKHSPDEFGLQADAINRQFAGYRERFGFGFGVRPPLSV